MRLAHFFIAALVMIPRSLSAAEWQSERDCRFKPVSFTAGSEAGFSLLSPEMTRVNFVNSLDFRQGARNRTLYNGSGVAVGDFDNDGLPDIYFCSLQGANVLYKNLGDWKFREVTVEAGVSGNGEICRGGCFADIDGDGWLDLLVSTSGRGVLCYHNDRNGRFRDATKRAGTASKFAAVTLALADVDGNGTLDLYVTTNRLEDIRDRGQVQVLRKNGNLVVPEWLQDRFIVRRGHLDELGEPDTLYLNDGTGQFTELSWTEGAFVDELGSPLREAPLDWGLTATFRDLDDNGTPDLYVCNDYWTPDRIWMNDGHARFHLIRPLALRHISGSSMGVDFADLDRDGQVDFMVVDMLSRDHEHRLTQDPAQDVARLPPGAIDMRPQILRNTLFRNRGDGTFAEVADYAGVAASEWSWQPIFVDVDLDGYDDILISAGHVKDIQDIDSAARIQALKRAGELVPSGLSIGALASRSRQENRTEELFQGMLIYPKLDEPIVAFRNRQNFQFEERTEDWGLNALGVHHGLAAADFDGDGDLDLVVNNLNAPAGLYRNNSGMPRVAVRLQGAAPNTQGIGAKIKLLGGAVPIQGQEVVCGGQYVSGSDPLRVFAAGKSATGMTIEVTWRTGKTTAITNVKSNRLYEIREGKVEIRK